jgi:hypothetical protein
MANSKGYFDVQAFYFALDDIRHARRINWKIVSEEAGVSQPTLSRMSKGVKPDIDSVAALVQWGDLNANDFMRSESREDAEARRKLEPSPPPLAQITAHLRADRHLSPKAAQALDVVIRAAYEELRKLRE